MPEVFGAVFRTVSLSAYLFSVLVLPPLIAGAALQFVTAHFRLRCAEVFGARFCVWATAPGVMLHEFSHAFSCLIFRHRITDFVLFSPQKNGNLGWVVHQWDRRSIWQRIGCFFIGVSPLAFGAAAIVFLTLLLLPPYEALPFPELPDAGFAGFKLQFRATFLGLCRMWIEPGILFGWRFWLWLYAMIAIGSQLTLSRSDLEGAASGAIVLAAMLAVSLLVLVLALPRETVVSVVLIRCSAAICGLLFYLLLLFSGLTLLLMVCLAGTDSRRRRN